MTQQYAMNGSSGRKCASGLHLHNSELPHLYRVLSNGASTAVAILADHVLCHCHVILVQRTTYSYKNTATCATNICIHTALVPKDILLVDDGLLRMMHRKSSYNRDHHTKKKQQQQQAVTSSCCAVASRHARQKRQGMSCSMQCIAMHVALHDAPMDNRAFQLSTTTPSFVHRALLIASLPHDSPCGPRPTNKSSSSLHAPSNHPSFFCATGGWHDIMCMWRRPPKFQEKTTYFSNCQSHHTPMTSLGYVCKIPYLTAAAAAAAAAVVVVVVVAVSIT